MDLLTIEINNKEFTYIDTITLNNNQYVAYMDDKNVYVSECLKNGNDVIFKEVNDDIYQKVIEGLEL